MADLLQKFLFEDNSVRGELVDVSASWQEVLSHRDYPAAVKTVLGEMMSAAVLLSANLKFNGAIVMQIHGDGPVRLMVVECDADLHLRATAKIADDTLIDEHSNLTQLVNVEGDGRFVITLDPKDKLPGQQPYQGIVPLSGDSIAVVIENYMLRSEQLDTRLWLAADGNAARGLLLQKLPHEGGISTGDTTEADISTWDRAIMLGATLQRDELLTTDIATLMHRLFWEETIRIFEPRHPTFQCSCTRDKVGGMLKMLGEAEIEEALSELGKLEINCDFCGQHYEFDRVDCTQLFAVETPVKTLLPADRNTH